MDLEKQKIILRAIKDNGGQISAGYLGEILKSNILAGRKTGIDPWKHNLQLLLDSGACKEMGENLQITSSVTITQKGYELLSSPPTSRLISVLKSDYAKLASTIVSLIKLFKEFLH